MPDTRDPQAPTIDLESRPGALCIAGPWLTASLAALEERVEHARWPERGALQVDASGLTAFDTGGAWYLRELLGQLRARGLTIELGGLRDEYVELLELVESRMSGFVCPPPPRVPSPLERLGRNAVELGGQGYAMLSFVGEATASFVQLLGNPRRLRWRELLVEIERAGVDALPIIGLLSFLIGIVIAYQGGVQLRTYGANIFVVELVTLTMLRELAPVMTAVIVAGRTGSAYAAQIGTMRVNEEVDALETIGIPPVDLLVLPKLVGLMIALPLLTMFADVLGVFGGMVMSAAMLGVDMNEFLRRIPEAVSVTSFMIGIGKAPVFALLIATVGCYQGFQVSGGADSVGRQTTLSVVQGIFLVIIADAAFSIVFSWLGI